MKRPKIINIILVFFLLTIPFDLFTAITLKENSYRENISNYEELVKKGKFEYRGKIVHWDKQSEAARQRVIHQLTLQKVILSKFFIFRIFKWLFIVLAIFLIYSLWCLKKWMPIVLLTEIFFVTLFNLIFPYFGTRVLTVFFVVDVIVLLVVNMVSRKYFIY